MQIEIHFVLLKDKCIYLICSDGWREPDTPLPWAAIPSLPDDDIARPETWSSWGPCSSRKGATKVSEVCLPLARPDRAKINQSF